MAVNEQGNNWLSVGRIRDAHGIKGEVFVALRAKQADWLESLEVFRLSGPTQTPKDFEVLAARPHKDGLIVTLVDVQDRNQAEALRGCRVEIPMEYVIEEDEEESLYLGQYLGLQVVDQTLGDLGQVVDLGSNGPQDLLVVQTTKGRFEIPLVEAFIVELNLQAKLIKVDLPEGLVEV
ncbi:MAG: ribosome maturation factor RimM [Bdellovibrionales bacterium]